MLFRHKYHTVEIIILDIAGDNIFDNTLVMTEENMKETNILETVTGQSPFVLSSSIETSVLDEDYSGTRNR